MLLPACLSVPTLGFVDSVLWSCCYQGRVLALFRCLHLFQPLLFWWCSLRCYFWRPIPTRLVCIVWVHFFISPHSLALLAVFSYHSTLRFQWVVSSFSNMLCHFVARYCITCPGYRFYIFLSLFWRNTHPGVLLLFVLVDHFQWTVLHISTLLLLSQLFSFFWHCTLSLVSCCCLLFVFCLWLCILHTSIVFYHLLFRRLCISILKNENKSKNKIPRIPRSRMVSQYVAVFSIGIGVGGR